MNHVTRAQDLIGNDVYDREGHRLGRVGNVYVDDATHRPEWITVRTGLLGMKETFVPLAGASTEGDRLDLEIARESVRAAPQVAAEHGHLSDEQGRDLYSHYGVERGSVPAPRRSESVQPSPASTDRHEPGSALPVEAMTLSDEGRHHRPESEPEPEILARARSGGADGRHRKRD